MTPELRAYRLSDASACLALFDGNTPAFFAPAERTEFTDFLRDHALTHAFQVVDVDGLVVACGGLSRHADGSAGFCWGMVAREHQGRGLGRMLAHARLRQAKADERVHRVVLSTSQHTQGFYAALGFHVVRETVDGHGPGLHAVEMELHLVRDPCMHNPL